MNKSPADIAPTGTPRHIPMWLLAELTYACPLQCPYCSNPVELTASRKQELSTGEWLEVMRQARKLGAVQLGFSGGEPMVRQDIIELVAEAVKMGYYCNLITSALGLDEAKITAFREAGLSHIQVSFQGSDAETNARFGGTDSYEHKLAMCREIVRQGLPLGLNFVLHRQNLHQVSDFLEMAASLGAEFVELANTQYYAWALHNREQLMPGKAQLDEAEAATNHFRAGYKGPMKVFFVAPDYYDDRPKKCSNGWGTTFLTVTPEGDVLPCQSARVIEGLSFPNVRKQPLDRIWHHSDLFQRFRGTDWMKEPCASCPEKEEDLGGCRCQAFLLTGDAANADPVCSKSPHHDTILESLRSAQNPDRESRPLVFRNPANAREISRQKDSSEA